MNAWNPPRIVTDRLVIRPMMVSDMQAFAQFTGSYDAARYGNWLGGTDRGSVARYIADTIARYGRPPRCDLGIEHRRQLIGGVAFRQVWLSPPALEVGWVLHPDHGGDGLATEALRGLLEYLHQEFASVSRYEARIRATDARAAKLLNGLGFQPEGVLRGGVDVRGNETNSTMFGMVRGELTL